MSAKPSIMRRFKEHTAPLHRVLRLAADHPAVTEGRSLFPGRVAVPSASAPVLRSGHHNRKIGAWVEKGKWAGMPILTLTLEERATCPRGCRHWLDCYGGQMQWPVRNASGPELEGRLEIELGRLQGRYPAGFVVRLHVLGDFMTVAYVERWLGWLDRFPALRVFGYTARQPGEPIGKLLRQASADRWDRFAIRLSNGGAEERGATTIYRRPEAPRVAEGVVCPAQHGPKADDICCGSCGLCWGTRSNIAFVAH